MFFYNEIKYKKTVFFFLSSTLFRNKCNLDDNLLAYFNYMFTSCSCNAHLESTVTQSQSTLDTN